jgi:hypothetical protein
MLTRRLAKTKQLLSWRSPPTATTTDLIAIIDIVWPPLDTSRPPWNDASQFTMRPSEYVIPPDWLRLELLCRQLCFHVYASECR